MIRQTARILFFLICLSGSLACVLEDSDFEAAKRHYFSDNNLDLAIGSVRKAMVSSPDDFDVIKFHSLLLISKSIEYSKAKTFYQAPVELLIDSILMADRAVQKRNTDVESHIYLGQSLYFAIQYLNEATVDLTRFEVVAPFQRRRPGEVKWRRHELMSAFVRDAKHELMAAAGLQPWLGELFLQEITPEQRAVAMEYLLALDEIDQALAANPRGES